MKIISQVQIKGFRSIRSINIQGLDDFTAFTGLNNSGKSNILRALNAFFNGQTDEGRPLNIDEDFYRPDLRRKKAKEISVSVTFSLPNQFTFRRDLKPVEEFLGGRQFKISKIWRRGQLTAKYKLGNRELEYDERLRVDQFLQLINFRYIPNRVLPTEVIKRERANLRDVLVRRLGKAGKTQEDAFAMIQEKSEKMISGLAKRLKNASSDIGTVRLETPTAWADMAFTFGYKLGQEGIEVGDDFQGSGIQSLLMLETLYLIDRDYFQKFGWRQAAIWAIEEPESSLHTLLEAQVAAYLSDISGASTRLQVLCTSHSDLMIQYASKSALVKRQGWETTCEIYQSPQDALDQLSCAGITRWVHPILQCPTESVVLVDGKYDVVFLEEAFKLVPHKRNVHITCLEHLDGDGATGGVDDNYRYIKSHAKAIKARRNSTPLIVVLDWETVNKEGQFRSLFTADDAFKVIVWPSTSFNPKLNTNFKGIERHFSDRLIEKAESKGANIYTNKNTGIRSVQSNEYGVVKKILSEIVKEGLEEADLIYAKDFVKEILRAAEAL